jgi:hypothetical protein
MLFTYLSMNDLFLLFAFNQSLFFCGSELSWANNILFVTDIFSFYSIFMLPGNLIYWIYEILHTYFVITVQITAFFAIVFWLFLFLYTFFVFEKQENYFYIKRYDRLNFFKNRL